MEALGILKFWRNAGPIADVSSDDDDSFFDLVLKSPDRGEIKGGDEVSKKDPQSPRDVLLSKHDFSNSKPLSPVTILRSTPKFKVFMLGLKKPSKSESNTASPLNQLSKSCKNEQSNRFGDAKCGAVEMPIASSFARDNSLRSKLLKESLDYDVVSSEKSVPKYMKLIKPFYTKSSKKVKSTTESNTPSCSPVTAPVNFSPRKLSDGSRIGSFKIVSRNLVKSRSASTTVTQPPLRRRDDSLLEQQNDGIQGAILHCKKSFNSSSKEYSQLYRSASDASYPVRKSCEEQKRYSI